MVCTLTHIPETYFFTERISLVIRNSRLSPCRGVRNHAMTDFVAIAKQPITDIFQIILFLLERLLFGPGSRIWYQIDQNSILHGALYDNW